MTFPDLTFYQVKCKYTLIYPYFGYTENGWQNAHFSRVPSMIFFCILISGYRHYNVLMECNLDELLRKKCISRWQYIWNDNNAVLCAISKRPSWIFHDYSFVENENRMVTSDALIIVIIFFFFFFWIIFEWHLNGLSLRLPHSDFIW